MLKTAFKNLLKTFTCRFENRIEMYRKGNVVTLVQNSNVIVLRKSQFNYLHKLSDLTEEV